MWRTEFLTRERVNKALREGQARVVRAVRGPMTAQRSWQHTLNIGSRLVGWFTARGIDQLTRKADRLFRENCSDPLLVGYSLGLPLSGLPEIQAALSVRGGQQGQDRLVDVIRAVISRDWRQLSPVQIEDAKHLYLCSLTWARQPRRLTRLTPAALLEAAVMHAD